MTDREDLVKGLKDRYSLNDVQIDNVLEYAYSLSQKATNPNDYALAYTLNELAIGFFEMVADNRITPDITKINKSYILISDALKTIYERNPDLKKIATPICWRTFDRLEYIHNEVGEYSSFTDGDYGYSHNAEVHRLCILNDKEVPIFTTRLQKIVDEAKINGEEFYSELNGVSDNHELDDGTFIPKYTLTYDNNGAIWVNKVLKLNKNHIGRNPDLLLSQSFKHDGVDEPFKPALATSRQLTTIIGDMGFDETLRKLFFPTINQNKGIVFRSTISRWKADSERINTSKLDSKLKKLGADTAKAPDSPIDLSTIPF